MDSFYASVEERDNPELKGKPLAVVWSGPRGVVLTANYVARAYGVRSAMPTSLTLKKYPELLLISPRMEVYREVSSKIHGVFRRYTTSTEPLSLDEAYLDVSHTSGDLHSAFKLAKKLKADILEETRLTASAGVSYNKFLAKLASGMNKPDDLTLISEDEAPALVVALPVEDFYGVGPKTAAKLKAMNVHTGIDLKRLTLEQLRDAFGKVGEQFYHLARAQDDRSVESERATKSLRSETTFEQNTTDITVLEKELRPLAQQVATRLEHAKLKGRTVTLKVKYANFKSLTRNARSSNPPTTLKPSSAKRVPCSKPSS